MKVKKEIAKKEPEPQTAQDHKLSGKVNEIGEQVRSIKSGVADLLGPLLILTRVLLEEGDDDLQLTALDGTKINFSTVSMASGELIETLLPKLYDLYRRLDVLDFNIGDLLDTEPAALTRRTLSRFIRPKSERISAA